MFLTILGGLNRNSFFFVLYEALPLTEMFQVSYNIITIGLEDDFIYLHLVELSLLLVLILLVQSSFPNHLLPGAFLSISPLVDRHYESDFSTDSCCTLIFILLNYNDFLYTFNSDWRTDYQR